MIHSRPLDLITMGRTIVDVYGDQVGARLEDVSSFSRYVGGCPANIAIGTARLGLRVGLITRVGDDHNGRFLRESLEREGVDTRHVVPDSQRLTAVAFLGIRNKDSFPLLHYRENCADMAIAPADYTEEYIGSARALLVSGSHLTTDAAAANIASAVERAKARGTKVIFDIDYRPVFWGLVSRDGGESRYVDSSRATEATRRFMSRFDLVVGTEEEIHIAGGDIDTIRALEAIRRLTAAPIVLKRVPQAASCSLAIFRRVWRMGWSDRASPWMYSTWSGPGTASCRVFFRAGCATCLGLNAAAAATPRAPWWCHAMDARLHHRRRRNSTGSCAKVSTTMRCIAANTLPTCTAPPRGARGHRRCS